MSGNAFEEFANAVSQVEAAPKAASVEYRHIAVLGGGGDARLVAALALAAGADVTLFSAYGSELDQLRSGGGITLRGDGPIGTFQIDRETIPSIKTTGRLDVAVGGADLIVLTGPVHKQRTYAMVLAEHLKDGQVLVLAPGRTLGAAEAAWLLRVGGCRADYTLVELQNLPFWFVQDGNQLLLSKAATPVAATLPASRLAELEALQKLFFELNMVSNTVQSGFHDGSALVELPVLMMGGPAMDDNLPVVPEGAKPIAANRTFRALIGSSHAKVISQLASERRQVASRFGVRDLPTDEDWLEAHAGSLRGEGARAVPDRGEALAMIRCGAIGSLAPLVSAAGIAGVDVPVTRALLRMASSLLDADIESAGRRLSGIGINSSNIDDARRVLDAVASRNPVAAAGKT